MIYHVNFPYPIDPFFFNNMEDNEGRRAFYGVLGVPNERVDGSQTGTSLAALTAAYDSRKATPTDVSLEISGSWNPDSRDVDVQVTATTTSPLLGDYRLHIVLTESEIYFDATNGIQIHDHTMRDMFPDAAGTPVVFEGDLPQTVQASASFMLPEGAPPHEFIAENCRIVCFLQETSGARSIGEIHQAAASGLTTLANTGVAELPARASLGRNYPNPFNPSTTIPVSVAKTGPVRLDVMDSRGRRIRTLHDGRLNSGSHTFRWNGDDEMGAPQASGVYLARIIDGAGTSMQRLVLLK